MEFEHWSVQSKSNTVSTRLHCRVAPLWAQSVSGLSKDMLPGPYPKTPEEWAAAAAANKYNMRVEDYEPYPDKDMGYGDYPKLPNRSQHVYRSLPLHWDFDPYLWTQVNNSLTTFFAFLGFMVFMFFIGYLYPSYQPWGQSSILTMTSIWEQGGNPNKKPPKVKHYEI
uniref:NADH dehydrogenase [ubiquinone] 1 beta subcomplex subunit 8, mitochondrial n=1 Tax=Sphenodon punctatus TaxID=8508 RepID=A0A8D0HGC7_SPHPU